MERSLFDKLKARIQLAREIDGLQHKFKREKHAGRRTRRVSLQFHGLAQVSVLM